MKMSEACSNDLRLSLTSTEIDEKDLDLGSI